MQKIKCAVIGVGYLGKYHVEKYVKIPNVELVAVCDTNKDCCNAIATQYNVAAITDYKELLHKVDAVSIVVPTSYHYEVAKFFLENKIHVLLEKPITTTVPEADELIKIAKTNQVILQVGHLERFNPILVALKERLHKPLYIESLRIAPFKIRATDVNVILDSMIHDIDIIQHIVGEPIAQINASGAPVLTNSADIVSARIEFVSGCVANVTGSRISFHPKRILRIFQHDAYFAGDLANKTLSIHCKDSGEMFPGIPAITREELTMSDSDPLYDEINAFVNTIQKNGEPLVSGEDGKKALATAIKITEIVSRNVAKVTQNRDFFK